MTYVEIYSNLTLNEKFVLNDFRYVAHWNEYIRSFQILKMKILTVSSSCGPVLNIKQKCYWIRFPNGEFLMRKHDTSAEKSKKMNLVELSQIDCFPYFKRHISSKNES